MKKFTSLLCGIMLCAAANIAFAQSGNTGPLQWEFADGTLTITGNGAMPDYSFSAATRPPWYDLRASITSVAIGDGVTRVGVYAFNAYAALASVTLGNSVITVGNDAFTSCAQLASINLPAVMDTIGNNAFSGCNLSAVTIPASVTIIGGNAFGGNAGLTAIEVAAGNPNYASDGGVLFNAAKTALLQCPAGKTGAYAIPASVTSLANSAFYQCKLLTSVTIPNAVTAIPDQCFYDCVALTSITIPEEVTAIGGQAFYRTGLTSVEVPNSVTTLGDYAFAYSPSLVSATLGNGITNMGASTFRFCGALESCTLPNGLTTIGGYVFQSCSKLTSVTIPETVTSVGANAFQNCTTLASVTLPEGVTVLNANVFNGCSSLTSFVINDAVTSTGMTCFNNCTGLTSVTIGSGTATIGSQTFAGCTSLTEVTNRAVTPQANNGLIFRNVTVGNITLKVPAESVDEYEAAIGWTDFGTIEAIDEEIPCDDPIGEGTAGALAWKLCPDGTFTITGEGAMPNYPVFQATPWNTHAQAITAIEIGDGVTRIGNNAFAGCTNLTSVMLGNAVAEIGEQVFSFCTSFVSIEVASDNAVYSSEDGVLFNKEKTEVVMCPAAKAGAYTIPASVTAIGNNAFIGCINLTSVVIPSSVTAIGDAAFSGCSGLTSMSMPNTVNSIGVSAFNNCTGLTSFTFPESVTVVSNSIFNGCTGLTSVTFSGQTTSIGEYAFAECNSLTSVTIPDLVTTIGRTSFYRCADLTSVTLGESVTTINLYAFAECTGLTEFTLPASVTALGAMAFQACTGLTEFTNHATTPQTVNANVFDGVTLAGITLKVPAESIDAYEAAAVWTDFGTIEATGEVTPCDNPIDEGTTGPLAWKLCPDGTFTITGEGAMPDYAQLGAPWYNYRNSVTGVEIGNGVTHIGNNAFVNFINATNVNLPASVISIGENAFLHCEGLVAVTLPNLLETVGFGAFNYCSALTAVTIPASVTAIGIRAFFFCTSLTSFQVAAGNPNYSSENGVLFNSDKTLLIQCPAKKEGAYEIPASVTAIGGDAFALCAQLTSITIPASVATIGDFAFSSCHALESFSVAADNQHFASDSGVLLNKGKTQVMRCPEAKAGTYIIPETVTDILAESFDNCKELTKVDIPAQANTIGEYAFVGCLKLSEVINRATTPQTIEDNIFWDVNLNTGILRVPAESVDDYEAAAVWTDFGTIEAIPDSDCDNPIDEGTTGPLAWKLCPDGTLTITGEGAMPSYDPFNNPTPWNSHKASIKTVIIGDGVTNIGMYAFHSCTALTSVSFGNTITSVSDYAFAMCSALTSANLPQSLVSVGRNGFSGCSMPTVTLGNSVTTLGMHAFAVNPSLTSVFIPESLTSIGTNAFGDCAALTAIDVAANNPNYSSDGGALFNKDKTTILQCPAGKTGEYIMPASVTAIGDNAFFGCKLLTSVIISSEVTAIPETCFYDCTALATITIPNKVTSIGGHAFNGSGLTTVTIPASVTTIGDYVFSGCKSLTSVTLGSSITAMGAGTFSDCTALTEVTIPNGITAIGGSAFQDCSSLASISIPASVTSIGTYAFRDCIALTSVTLPEQLTAASTGLFFGCTALSSMVFPESVTTIGDFVFSNCTSLSSVTFGSAVTSFATNTYASVFSENPNLAEIINHAVTPVAISNNVFFQIDLAAVTLKVPAQSVAAYEVATVWQNFGTIEGIGAVDEDALRINFADGQNVTTPINETLRVSFDGDTALVNTVDGENRYQLQDVNSFSFADAEETEQYFTDIVFYKNGEVTYQSVVDYAADSIKFPVYVEPDGYIEINGVKWAVANVDAPDTFAENQWAAGMFYQWNRPVGWSSTDPLVNHEGGTTWDSSMPTGDVWEESNNVCPSGYRLPTKEEFESLAAVAGEWGILGGQTGWFFGTGEVRLFLPAVGARVGYNGNLTSPNELGSYRSGTVVTGGAYALQFLKIGDIVINPALAPDALNGASSIRCVVAE